MKAVFVWPNTGKKKVAQALAEICTLLQEREVQVLLPQESRGILPDIAGAQYVSQWDGIQACDFVISLGGDGTILRIAEDAARAGKPLLGINFGHLGFMTELECSEIPKIHKILDNKYSLDHRMMLEVRVMRKDKELFRQVALNDVTVTKSNPFRVMHANISSGGVPVTSFAGDGVIVATPTGSTAYSLSAGGPVIEPTAENIVVTPVCAHNLFAKAFVFAPQREICIQAQGADQTGVCMSTDGRCGVDLQPIDKVLVRKSKLETRLIRVKGKSFYHILEEKLSGER